MEKFSYLNSANSDYIDELLGRYQSNPESIDPTWRYFFEGLEFSAATESINLADGLAQNGAHLNGAAPSAGPALSGDALLSEARVAELIAAYKTYGKKLARVNPLVTPPSEIKELELARFGLSASDLDRPFLAARFAGFQAAAPLKEIIARLKQTYCATVGIETSHMENLEAKAFINSQVEAGALTRKLDVETQTVILSSLTNAEGFERFLHTRYVAQKRFSVEGGDGVLPALESMIEASADHGASDIIIGMAHRGRLNVLTHTMGKSAHAIFSEFEGQYKIDSDTFEGDVKYHKGYSADRVTRSGKNVHLSLAFNPSHLEFVGAVVEGMARAKQDRKGDVDGSKVVPIVIHGDAALAGQGVCYEMLNFSLLPGYKTGGTLHVVINNQVGFTTDPSDARSSQYCTDLAKVVDAPVFHVNGDDAEAIWNVCKLAADYRARFKSDVFIDIICYRKYGHNEGDEPAFTQPLLYKKIKTHPSPRDAYVARLTQSGSPVAATAQKLVDETLERLSSAQTRAKAENPAPLPSMFEGLWKGLKQPKTEAEVFEPAKTSVEAATLKAISQKINHVPAGFTLHSKLQRFFEARMKAVEEGKGIDWGNAEALAYASLISENTPVRITGQDAERGTFTHRHSVVHDFETGQSLSPINAVATKEAKYEVFNSLLSETAVMGFEYGYAIANPAALTIWEAQFGDFANGAQVIIDQFIATSESKWGRMNGLVLLLPHGYEGQGPEHSSARLERFLALCGKQNMIVANLTTPAQIFHALRRQVRRSFRKPLVIMSPKSLLRHPQAVSTLEELSMGRFCEVLDDPMFMMSDPTKVKRVLLCSGKVYYDLVNERGTRKRDDVAVVRIEQLYPWPADQLAEILGRYSGAKDFIWVQEEPRNMGGWSHVFGYWMGGFATFSERVGGLPIRYVGRAISASPAVGAPKVHEAELKLFLNQAFGD